MKEWAWESYWMIYAISGLVVVPLVLALATSPNVFTVLGDTPAKELAYCYLCGAIWGIGGMTWGLMIRYLGVGLGLAIGCGLCSATGTLVPPILKGNVAELYTAPAAPRCRWWAWSFPCWASSSSAWPACPRKANCPRKRRRRPSPSTTFKKGILVAIFSGVTSSGMSFGLAEAAATIEKLALETSPATSPTWQGIPVLVVVLLGGFTVNALLCLFLNFKNRTFGDYAKPKAPLLTNLVFAALAGTIWCCQFIAFKTGGSRDGLDGLHRLGRAHGHRDPLQQPDRTASAANGKAPAAAPAGCCCSACCCCSPRPPSPATAAA